MKQVVISVLGSVREDVLQAQIYTHGEQRQPPGCASISAHVCSYDRVYICLFWAYVTVQITYGDQR